MQISKLKVLYIRRFAYQQICTFISGSSSFGRAVAFQASGGRFEPGLPLKIVNGQKVIGQSGFAIANCLLLIDLMTH